MMNILLEHCMYMSSLCIAMLDNAPTSKVTTRMCNNITSSNVDNNEVKSMISAGMYV